MKLIEKYGDKGIKSELQEYISENEGDPAELAEEFVDEYEDECGIGDWGVIVHLLRARHPNLDFQYNDYVLYVGAYFPENEEDKKNVPTCAEIRDAV